MTERQNPPPKMPARILRFGINAILVILCVVLAILSVVLLSVLFGFAPDNISVFGAADQTPSKAKLLLSLLAMIIIAVMYLYAALQVRAIIQTTLAGNPFVEANISRLRKTWVVIALAELLRLGFESLNAPMQDVNADSTWLNIEINLSVWFLVFILAAMAEAFRIGLEMKRDQDLTI